MSRTHQTKKTYHFYISTSSPTLPTSPGSQELCRSKESDSPSFEVKIASTWRRKSLAPLGSTPKNRGLATLLSSGPKKEVRVLGVLLLFRSCIEFSLVWDLGRCL